MDNDTDRIVAGFNLEEIITNYNTWNHVTVHKQISSLTFVNVNLLQKEVTYQVTETHQKVSG